jgi:hypothetical protein
MISCFVITNEMKQSHILSSSGPQDPVGDRMIQSLDSRLLPTGYCVAGMTRQDDHEKLMGY